MTNDAELRKAVDILSNHTMADHRPRRADVRQLADDV